MNNGKFQWDDEMILQLYRVAKYSNTHVNNNQIKSGTQENKFTFISANIYSNPCTFAYGKYLHCSVICINRDP